MKLNLSSLYSIYYHSSDKQELLYLIHERFINDLLSETQTAVKGLQDPRERLDVIVRIAVRALARHLPAAGSSLANCVTWKSRIAPAMREKRDQYELLWRETLERGVQSGHFRATVDPALCTRSILGMIKLDVSVVARRRAEKPGGAGATVHNAHAERHRAGGDSRSAGRDMTPGTAFVPPTLPCSRAREREPWPSQESPASRGGAVLRRRAKPPGCGGWRP